jgi:hypothetical protein
MKEGLLGDTLRVIPSRDPAAPSPSREAALARRLSNASDLMPGEYWT